MGYDYLQNTALNATPFGFNGVAGRNSPIHFNDLGGNVGGPVIKNRVFFFFDAEDVISKRPGRDFHLGADGRHAGRRLHRLAPIYDPTSQTVDASGVVTRQPFANNQIPANLIDPVAKKIQAYFPQPNLPGTVVNGVTTNNYAYQFPSSSPNVKYFGRFDADVTKNNRITGSAAWNDGPAIRRRSGLPAQLHQSGYVQHQQPALRLLDHQRPFD